MPAKGAFHPLPPPQEGTAGTGAHPLRTAPACFSEAGTALWERLVAVYELSDAEVPQLELACRQADDVAHLERLLAEQGGTVVGSTGQPRLSPVFAELRQARLALSKLLGAVGLPDEENRPLTAAQRNAQHAAQARWRQTRARQEQRRRRLIEADGTA